MQHLDKTLATYVWSRWNILNRYLQHTCIAIAATYPTSKSTFLQHPYGTLATYIWNIWNTWHICLQYKLLVQTWANGVTNWRNGGGPMRRPQQARRATSRANPRGAERAMVWAGRARGAQSERRGQGVWSCLFGHTDTHSVALLLKTMHGEILAQYWLW
jgi:hypothetical protein